MTTRQATPVRIGLIGAGAIMRLSHAPTVKATEGATLTAVFDPDRDRAEALTADFGGRAYERLETILAAPDVDAFLVATPTRSHEEAVVAAAAHGRPVSCKNPLTLDVQSARRMVDACR